MLIEFSVANFRSFKELQTLTMSAANLNSKNKEIDKNNVVVLNEKLKFLKTKAIYGANASGKSNLTKALNLFINCILFSVKEENILKMVHKFELSTNNDHEPSFFQIIFTAKNEENKDILYRYGFETKNGEIVTEWLFGSPYGREVPFFVREQMKVKVNKEKFKEAKKFESLTEKDDNKIFRKNSLFLTAVWSMGGIFTKNLIGNIRIMGIYGLNDKQNLTMLQEKIESEDKNKILTMLKDADLNIDDIGLLEVDQEKAFDHILEEFKPFLKKENLNVEPQFYSEHSKYDDNNQKIGNLRMLFNEWESEGTKKFFYLIPLLIYVLDHQMTLIIDEFDARLHPLLTRKIVDLFHSETTNPNHAQLIFVTHDLNLLKADLLRRDQICFVEKDRFGASILKDLANFKGVRNDASFDKEYMQGEYGAIPFLNNLDKNFVK